MIQSLQTSHPSRISIDAPELLEIQRQGFYKFIKEGIIEEFSKISPIKLETGKNSLEFILDAERYKFIYPEDTPRECILKMKTYGCKIYIEAKFVCKRTADKKIVHNHTEWILVGNLPMMTKRGHFIINGSPRVIVHQVVRAPGIYFQQIVDKGQGKETRFYGDIIPRRGAWLRLQINQYGKVDARLKKSKKVEAELLQRCLEVIEKESSLLPSYGIQIENQESVSENTAFYRTYDKLYRPIEDKEREEVEARQGHRFSSDAPSKRQKCYKNLFETFKVPARYDLGQVGREKLNHKFGLDVKEQQLTCLDIKAAISWLQDLQKGYKVVDDIDHSQNRRIRSSGELLQNQFENGVDRLKKLIWVKLKDLGAMLDRLEYERSQTPVLLAQSQSKSERGDFRETRTSNLGVASSPSVSTKGGATANPSRKPWAPLLVDGLKEVGSRSIEKKSDKNLKKELNILKKVSTSFQSTNVSDFENHPLAGNPEQGLTNQNSVKTPTHTVLSSEEGGEGGAITPQTQFSKKQGRDQAFIRRDRGYGKNDVHTEISLKDVITTKPINGALREFFGSNPLSQYMDQTNPLAELTHKRRISSLGVGGVSRESAGMAIRGIHPTHYGRICPIETPEGKNAGLVNSLAFYAKVNDKGFIETPYYKVVTGQVQQELGFSYFSAKEEDEKGLYIAPSDLYQSTNNVLGKICLSSPTLPSTRGLPFLGKKNSPLQILEKTNPVSQQTSLRGLEMSLSSADDYPPQKQRPKKVQDGFEQPTKGGAEEELLDLTSQNYITRKARGMNAERKPLVPVRVADNFVHLFQKVRPHEVDCIAISPIQMISVATSLIPFLEHNDANRALMGSNMQRQAVPLMIAERPLVGTGLEALVVAESGHIMQAEITGYVSSVSADQIIVEGLSKSCDMPTGKKNSNSFRCSRSTLFSRKQNLQQVTLGSFYQLNGIRQETTSLSKKQKQTKLNTKNVASRLSSADLTPHVVPPPDTHPSTRVASTIGGGIGLEDFVKDNVNVLAKPYIPNSTNTRNLRVQTTGDHPTFGGVKKCEPPFEGQELRETFTFTPFSHSIPNFQRSNQDTCLTQRCLVKEGDWVQRGDVLTDCSASNYGELSVGKNILIAYIPWEGYNFEDAIVISERLVQEHVYTSLHVERYDFEAQDFKGGNEWFTNILPGVALKNVKHLDQFGLPRIGSFVQEGDILVGKISCSDKKPTTPYERLLSDILEERSFAARDASLYVPRGVQGRVINQRVIESFDHNLENRKFKGGFPKAVHVFLAEKRRIQVGDKMSGRHGNKGIVSNILPKQDMPYLPDGTPIDMILNPLGVPSRMNVGQVFECLLGLAGNYLGQQFKMTAFDEIYGPEASQSLVYLKLYQARLQSGQSWLFQVEFPGKTRLIDGRTGECFDQWITVGKAYMLKLIHMVNDKIHARATGPYALVTQQPLRGRSQQGGQRLGEMEVWALEGFGAAYILQELLTKKSDDVIGRKEVAASILPRPTSILDMLEQTNNVSKNNFVLGSPEIFKVLVCELQSLCLDVGVYSLTDQSFQRKFVAEVD